MCVFLLADVLSFLVFLRTARVPILYNVFSVFCFCLCSTSVSRGMYESASARRTGSGLVGPRQGPAPASNNRRPLELSIRCRVVRRPLRRLVLYKLPSTFKLEYGAGPRVSLFVYSRHCPLNLSPAGAGFGCVMRLIGDYCLCCRVGERGQWRRFHAVRLSCESSPSF